MSERDKQIWGMIWRYGLVMLAAAAAIRIAMAVFAGNLLLQIAAIIVIILVPMYLAERARQASLNP